MNINWFNNKFHTGRFPVPSEITKSTYETIINVSDEYIELSHALAVDKGIRYLWFPMNETTSDMGINSIYAAMQIIYLCESNNESVLVHCHAGACRSPLIKELYLLMKTGVVMDAGMILHNINSNHLPEVYKLRKFLETIHLGFQKEEIMRGGIIEKAKIELYNEK